VSKERSNPVREGGWATASLQEALVGSAVLRGGIESAQVKPFAAPFCVEELPPLPAGRKVSLALAKRGKKTQAADACARKEKYRQGNFTSILPFIPFH